LLVAVLVAVLVTPALVVVLVGYEVELPRLLVESLIR
jgi:hypothetical protein